MALRRRKCFRFLAVLILLAICSLCLSGYFFGTKIYAGNLPFVNIADGKGTNNALAQGPRDTARTYKRPETSIVPFNWDCVIYRRYYTKQYFYKRAKMALDRSPDRDPYDVIILTYMRSGSTFIGKLLGARDDAFYWYEPLWATHKWKFHSQGQLLCDYRKDGCKNISSTSPQSVKHSLEFLLDIYNCDLKGHFNRFSATLHGSAGFAGATGKIFKNCMDPYKNCKRCLDDKSRGSNARTTAQCHKCPADPVKDCYNKWIERCNTTTHRATKVLRLDTSHAKYLLENHKRLKLVQVFRDPRAVISSRNVTKWYYGRNDAPNNITNDAMVLCRRIENDLANAKQLKTLFPDRVKIIQYEDFYDPNRTAVILYEFLNMKMTHYVKKSILAPLKANSPKNRHKRAGFHPDSYRDKLDTSVVLATNKHCKKVFDSLGLRTFNNAKEVKNRNLSVILDKLPYPLD